MSSKAPASSNPPIAKAAATTGSGDKGGWWAALSDMLSTKSIENDTATDCAACSNERVVACGNCDGEGSYVTYGRTVQCNCCKGTGLVICRECFQGDPWDVEGIRATVRAAAERKGRLPSS